MAPDAQRQSAILQQVLDQGAVQVWGVDRDLNLTYLRGGSLADTLPEPLETYVGGPLAAVQTPESEWVLDRHRAAFEGEPQSFEVRWRGRVMWVRLEPPVAERDEVAGLAMDVTERVQTRDRLEHLFDTLGQGVVFQAPTGEITAANQAAQEILGLTLEQMTGRTSTDPEWRAVREDGSPLPGEEHPAMVALREKRVVSGMVMAVINPRDDHYRWIRATSVPRFGPDGEPVEVFSSFEDITELKEALEALEESQRLLQETGEMARVGGWEVDPQAGKPYWSPVTRAIHGVDEDFDPSLEDAFAFFPGPARDRIAEAVRRALEEGVGYDLELPFVTAGGDERWVRTIGKAEFEDGRCVRLHGTFQDITELRERERELERVNRALAFVSAANAALIQTVAGADPVPEICDVAIEIGGYAHIWIGHQEDPDQPIAVHQADHSQAIDLFGYDSLKQEIEAAQAAGLAFVTRGLEHGIEPWERRLADEGYATLAILPFPSEASLDGFVAFAHTDPAALTQDELTVLNELVSDLAYGLWVESMHDELHLVRKAVSSLTVGVSIIDATRPDLPLVYVNEGFTETTGYQAEEVLGRHCSDLLQGPDTDPETAEEIARAFREVRSAQVTILNYRKSGKPFWNRVTIEPVHNDTGDLTHFVATQEDVTERRRMGQELEHRARLSAIGELAGGVAHDFRNILTAAQGLLELSLDGVAMDSDTKEDLQDLRVLIRRGTAVTERLLVLSRRAGSDLKPTPLRHVLEGLSTLLNHTVRDDVTVVVDEVPEAVVVRLDEDQFTTALLNLARNAEQAMAGGGTLTLDVAHPVSPWEYGRWPVDIPVDPDTPWVCLSLRDTGVGMEAEAVEHAFDPYFTTKKAGEGTGLGLPMVYSVVDGLGGRVWIESEPGEGTAVHMLLPTVDADLAEIDAASDRETQAAPGRRTGAILIAEDDATVLKVFRKGLERAGHTVRCGEDGVEALKAFRQDPDRIDLVVTDGFMPRMSGAELARAVWKERPDVPVLVTSGFGSEDIRPEFPDDPPGELVFQPKPLSIEQLLESVQSLLSRSRREIP